MATKRKKVVSVSVTITRLHRLTGSAESSTKAFADVRYGDMNLKGYRVVQGEKILFVSAPQERGKNDKWYSTVIAQTPELRKQISDVILAAYNAPVARPVAA